MYNDYYVYERFRKDDNTCFYVGEGRGRRRYATHRNILHDAIAERYGFYTKIYKSNLTQDEACDLEINRIQYYLDNGYGINVYGEYTVDDTKFLTNASYGGEKGFSEAGELNPQYHVSPKERMGDHYDEWLRKTSERLRAQVGDKNPNYHNDTLKKKLEANPELKVLYYSRSGEQNGRAIKVKLYKGNEYIDTFGTIGDACQYIKDILNLNAQVKNMRTNLAQTANGNKLYHGYRVEKVY